MDLVWINRFLTETSVYWEPPSRDGLGGYTWAYPREIKTRWRNEPKLVYDPNGAEVLTNSEIWATTNLITGGYVWRGTINDVQTIFEPSPDFTLDDLPTEKIRDMAAQIVKITRNESIVDSGVVLIKAFLI